VRQIGVCNYTSGLLIDLMAYANIAPAMLQIEAHPFLTQEPLIRLAAERRSAHAAGSGGSLQLRAA
jgi:D-xylose reductase